MTRKPISIGLACIPAYACYRRILQGIRRYMEAKPLWQIISFVPESSRRLPGQHRPDGLIAAVNTTQLVDCLAGWRRPIVNVAGVCPGLRFPRVAVDNVRIGQLAATHFLDRGLRHFGFIGPPAYTFSMERRAAFCQAVREAGYAAVCYEGVADRPFDPLGRVWDLDRSVARWLRALPKPVGILTPNDLWGVQVSEACRRAELRVPEDMALLGVEDDDLYCEMTRPPLSSIIVPYEQIGYEAAALLDRLLAGERPPRQPILLPPTGVATRRSTDVLAIDDKDVVAAVRFIRDHADLPLRVADVVQQVPVGRRTLERRCHLALGRGLGEEIRRTHLERASRLLAETDLSMKVLAKQAGFSDFRTMALVFRQELGMTPTAYRRQVRNPG